MNEDMKDVLRYVAILLFVLLIAALLAGCKTTRPETNTGKGVQMSAPMRQPTMPSHISVEPLVQGGGQPVGVLQRNDEGEEEFVRIGEYEGPDNVVDGYRVSGSQMDGVIIGTDDIAMQMGMLAQGLPTENWFQAILPDLFGPNIEEVRSDVIMYGAQLQMWAKTVVEIGAFKVGSTKITHILLDGSELIIETPSFETPVIRVPTRDVPPIPRSLSGLQRLGVDAQTLVSGLIAFFVFDFAKSNEPTVVETPPAQVIEVPTPQ